MRSWAVYIRKTKDNIVWAFPYYLPKGSMPPYPGFEVLELWLQINYPDAKYTRLYNNGNSVLEVSFKTVEDTFMFILAADTPKTVK